MSYQVLARKWRPKTFAQLIGQDHVVKALVHALDNDRLHHAFLFTGTRGVGKTTISRIFAKSLNCESGVTSTPCGQCAICQEIDQGRFVDLIEIDAASRTKVEDTREILDNVQYAPTRGRYKIYLIDEVHMLSNHSFNALLKTLEEPPEHVKFLLATTDPQKLPITVLSRCLQFNLKRLPVDLIQAYLTHVLDSEQVVYDQPALIQIADAADGSMRDALSLLDQTIAFGGGKVSDEDVRSMLGTINRDAVLHLAGAIADGDGNQAIRLIRALANQSVDLKGLLKDLIDVWQKTAVAQMVPDALDAGTFDPQRVRRLADGLDAETTQLLYQIGLIGLRDFELAPSAVSAMEMLALRMIAFQPESSVKKKPLKSNSSPSYQAPPPQEPAVSPALAALEAVAKPQGDDATSAVLPVEAVVPDFAEPKIAGIPESQPPVAEASESSTTESSEAVAVDVHASLNSQDVSLADAENAQAVLSEPREIRIDDWDDTCRALALDGMARQLAENAALTSIEGHRIAFIVNEHSKHLATDAQKSRLQQALSDYFGCDIKVDFEFNAHALDTPAALEKQRQLARQKAAEQSVYGDSAVKKLQEVFHASILPDSIKPLKTEDTL